MDDLLRQVRALHHATETPHAVLYLRIDEALRAWEDLGLEPLAQGYVAGRAAPMGPVDAGVTRAVFHNFSPGLVADAVPSAWAVASPAEVLAARADALERFFARVDPPDEGRDEATALARRAVEGLDLGGRPLAAANADVEPSGDPWADWWQAHAVLREYRGDGHVAALVHAGLDAVEALVVAGDWQPNLSRRFLQSSRAWDDEAFAAAEDRLEDRGWWADGALTEHGRDAREELEATTDRLAAAPWASLDATQRRTVFDVGCRVIEAINAAGALRRDVPVPTWPA